jgi:hypothetical protein
MQAKLRLQVSNSEIKAVAAKARSDFDASLLETPIRAPGSRIPRRLPTKRLLIALAKYR